VHLCATWLLSKRFRPLMSLCLCQAYDKQGNVFSSLEGLEPLGAKLVSMLLHWFFSLITLVQS